MKIIVINGAPHSGKDLFVELCSNAHCGQVYNLSTVDRVKEIARNCDWNGEKTPAARKFLSELKRILCEFNDLPYRDIETKVDQIAEDHDYKNGEPVVFIHSREPEDIQKFVDRMEAKTLLIRRPNGTDEISNASDAGVENYGYDYYIDNDGTIAQYYSQAADFMDFILKNRD